MVVDQEWSSEADIKVYLLRLIERGYVLIALVASLASTSRAFYTGWQSLYTVHLALSALVFVVHRCPLHVLPARPRIYFAVLVPAIVGLSGLYTFGFYGNGLAWTIVACAMAAVFLPLRALLAYIACIWLTILII